MPAHSPHSGFRLLILCGFGLSGAAALIYEVVWTRALSLSLGSTTYALSIMLASFMAGLALGAYLEGRFADKQKNPVATFAFLEIGIALFGIGTFIVIRNISLFYAWVFYKFHLSSFMYNWAQFVLSFVAMLIPTTLMGATFPVVLKIYSQSFERLGKSGGTVYAMNSLGAVCGALAAGFLLIPLLGVSGANLSAALANFFIGSILLIFSIRFKKAFMILAGGLTLILLLAEVSLSGPKWPFSIYLARRYNSYEQFQKTRQEYSLLFESEDASGKVQVFAIKGSPRDLYLLNQGKVESTPRLDLDTLLLLAWLPQAYCPQAKTYLNIGLGTGTTVRAALEEGGLIYIDSVEINREILKAVKTYFYPELFENPRVNHILADARNYLFLSDKKYDIISSEPSYPTDSTVGNLFTREFFELVKSRLNEKGVFAQWIPVYLLSHPDPDILYRNAGMMVKTFVSVFPQTYVWQVKGDMILVGLKGVNDLNPEDVKGIIAQKLEKSDLPHRWGTELSGERLLSRFNLEVDREKIQSILNDPLIQINTDDHPRLEFIVARSLLYPIRGRQSN